MLVTYVSIISQNGKNGKSHLQEVTNTVYKTSSREGFLDWAYACLDRGLLATRAHPRPAPGERAPRSSGGVIEPRAVRRRGSSDQVPTKTKTTEIGGFCFWWSIGDSNP